MRSGDRDVRDVAREIYGRVNGHMDGARRFVKRSIPWFLIACGIYAATWCVTKAETHRLCLKDGQVDSAVTWDLSEYCLHVSAYAHAFPVEKNSRKQ